MNDLLNYFNGDELAASTWKNKYAMEGETTPDDMHRRLAKEFGRIEREYADNTPMSQKDRLVLSPYGNERKELKEEDIYELFKNFKYIIPGGSVMSGLGTGKLVSLSNCFVIGSPVDSYSSIMNTRSQQVQLMKRRGGVGYDLSNLRPRGTRVNNAAAVSTGAASFMEVCSDITNEVAQGGRRGALMLSISINHPDIEEFITKKQDLTKVTGANISVKVTDEFMRAVINDEDYLLRWPVHTSCDPSQLEEMEYDKLLCLGGALPAEKRVCLKKIKARKLWNTLMHCAYNTAEPGIMFENAMHDYAPDGVYPEFKMIGTNPCGEIPMGPFDSCRLIHINLTSYIKDPFMEESYIDKDLLYKHSYEAMRLADDLVDLELEAIDRIINIVKDESDFVEFNLWSRIRETTRRGRRAGLGFTGLADAIAMLGLKYDSDEGIQKIEDLMRIIFKGQLDSQIDMAIERGAFPAWDSHKEYIVMPHCSKNKWYEFLSDNFHTEAIKMKCLGRRNISWSTVAPTGTVSIMAQCSSGIEPVFLPFYRRKRKCMSPDDKVDYTDVKGEKYTLFTVVHPNLAKWLCYSAFKGNFNDPEYLEKLQDMEYLKEAFKKSPYYGSTAPEIDWKQRIKLQGIVQKYITHSISSTINLPKEITEEEIADIYIEAWRTGNKGQTIYRDGCREGVLNKIEKSDTVNDRQAPKRPEELEADYHQVKVKGEQFIVLIGLLEGKPYEIFAFRPLRPIDIPPHKGKIIKKGKMHYSFDSKFIQLSDLQLANTNIEEKAATLYASMLLRHGVSIEYIIKTAKKVNENITSFSSAMCRILAKYIKPSEVKGEVCPECGGNLVRDNGCLHCVDCGYSRCD